MASALPAGPSATSTSTIAAPGGKYGFALSVLASLFFMWGFITVLDDILVPHLKAVFDLNYTESMLVQFIWYIGYFVMALPSARLVERVGYKKSLVIGLLVMAAGCLGFLPASNLVSFPAFLAALFVVVSGITLLQVAANPYVAVIGPAESAPARLNLVQALNSMGAAAAPLFGSLLILGRSTSGTMQSGHILTQAEKLADARSVQLPYLGLVVVLIALAAIIGRLKLPDLGAATRRLARTERTKLSLWDHKNLIFGVPAIFLYMIIEIGVGSLFISYIKQPGVGNMTAAQAGLYLPFLWGGMMVGRFLGAGLMQFIPGEKVLAAFSACAFALLAVVIVIGGPISLYALMAIGLFHSIMFPTIFTLGIKGLGPLTEEGSGLLIMAIAGGAVAEAQGWLADHYSLQMSFLLPAACELYMLWYALRGSRATKLEAPETLSA